MKIRCIAIDDEPLALQQMGSYIRKTPFLQLEGMFESAFQALDFLASHPVDLMFLDINMPDFNGLDFAKSLTVKPKIILITAYSEYALEGFRIDALDYLLKPIPYPVFLKSVNKAKEWFQVKADSPLEVPDKELFVKSEGKLVKIRIEDILYVESANEYIRINLDNKEVVVTLKRLKELEEELPADHFLRIHRSFIVHTGKVKAVERLKVLLNGNVPIPVGELYRTAYQEYVDKAFRKG
jgi:two-component system LytT family response regulator